MEEMRNVPFSNNQDRLSNLPESLIHHILSFLDMKYVVQTSILSRKWRYTWTTVSTLVFESDAFNDSGEKKVQSFMRFVTSILMLNISDIDKFDLYYSWDSDKIAKHLNTWILAVVKRKVQELNIQIEYSIAWTMRLPHCLVTSESLTRLLLDFPGSLVLPDSMNLPRLKSLYLGALEIDDIKCVNKLLSSCPVLESLVIKEFCVRAGHELRVNICKLKDLDICPCHCGESALRIIKLCTPNLTSFTCEDYMINEYCLENLSSLATANVQMTKGVGDTNIGKEDLFLKRILVFLMAFQNVNELTLSSDFLQVLSEVPSLIECQLPQFRNLRYLKLDMRFIRCCLFPLAYLLTSSPCMESLFITSKELDSEDDGEVVLSGSCILSHLKYIEMREVKGCNNELIFLEFVLKNAIVLEEMVLYFCDAGSSPSTNTRGVPDKLNVMKKFSEKVKALPRVSSSLIMLFC
ncbi:putative F-box/FBD/LRR-repeat protein At1g78760 [Papaver somniferum]|uniref:putative F-box/FBD/LRR-repeat protein At1g78760 n=1 Tax=Papaver somniferum TaxID=3469 RepID=UPI000E6FD52B|nr:putative F-box/FBD/LRR-repeat protein At1g78760 [Papaver somniferum]